MCELRKQFNEVEAKYGDDELICIEVYDEIHATPWSEDDDGEPGAVVRIETLEVVFRGDDE